MLGKKAVAAAEVASQVPYLRRYAHALTGDRVRGDTYVQACLESLLHDRRWLREGRSLRLELFRRFHEIWWRLHGPLTGRPPGPVAPEQRAVQRYLQELGNEERQALLLNALEGFPAAEVAYVLDMPLSEVHDLIGDARRRLPRHLPANVLVIEDEPMIAWDLSRMLTDMGYTVVGAAATQQDAVLLARSKHPDLILADVVLGRGGSGAEAVREIRQFADVPAIYVTAYPEQCQQGARDLVVAKPFRADDIRGALARTLV